MKILNPSQTLLRDLVESLLGDLGYTIVYIYIYIYIYVYMGVYSWRTLWNNRSDTSNFAGNAKVALHLSSTFITQT